MWEKLKINKQLDSKVLIELLAKIQEENLPITFSFQNKDNQQITYLVNTTTILEYTSDIISNANNIKAWKYISE